MSDGRHFVKKIDKSPYPGNSSTNHHEIGKVIQSDLLYHIDYCARLFVWIWWLAVLNVLANVLDGYDLYFISIFCHFTALAYTTLDSLLAVFSLWFKYSVGTHQCLYNVTIMYAFATFGLGVGLHLNRVHCYSNYVHGWFSWLLYLYDVGILTCCLLTVHHRSGLLNTLLQYRRNGTP